MTTPTNHKKRPHKARRPMVSKTNKSTRLPVIASNLSSAELRRIVMDMVG